MTLPELCIRRPVFTTMLVSLARSIRARAEDLQRRNADIQQVVEERTHELAASKERALVTLESIADGVVTSDANGTIDYLNPVAERLSGWSEKDLVGRSIADLFKVLDETSGQEVENPALGCLRSGIPVLHHGQVGKAGAQVLVEVLLLGGVAHGDHREFANSSCEVGGLGDAGVERDSGEAGLALALARVEVEPAELFDVGDAEE